MQVFFGRRSDAYSHKEKRTGTRDRGGFCRILSYHRGELPDSRMRMHASRRGYNLTHRSRPVCTEDFYHFDMIIGMDDRNIEDLMERAPDLETEKKIHRMTDYCRTKVADYVPDPYYGGAQGFENVLDILEDACAGLLTSLVPGN